MFMMKYGRSTLQYLSCQVKSGYFTYLMKKLSAQGLQLIMSFIR